MSCRPGQSEGHPRIRSMARKSWPFPHTLPRVTAGFLCVIVFQLVGICFLLTIFHAFPDSLPSTLREREELEKRSSAAPPLIIYRTSTGVVRGCIVPGLCSVENPSSGSPQMEYYVAEKYKPFSTTLRSCFPKYHVALSLYSGAQPSHRNVTTYNVDILGRSIVSRWYAHLAHFAFFMIRRLLVPVSLFRAQGSSPLPHPICVYPGRNTTEICKREDIVFRRPRVLTSKEVYNSSWNRALFKMLESVTGPSALVHIASHASPYSSSELECYRSGVVTPESYNSEDEGHDTVLRLAGVKRNGNCTGRAHVTLVFRKAEASRSVNKYNLDKLRNELVKKNTLLTVEWIEYLGGLTFEEQFSLMQRTDVLVSVHGAELSNVMFMRHGARVVEIMPFGYSARYFGLMAEQVHVKLVMFPTYPEEDVFYNCLLKRDTTIAGKVKDLIWKFRNASSWEESSKIALTHLPSFHIDMCARKQHIRFNLTKLVQVIEWQATERCSETVKL